MKRPVSLRVELTDSARNDLVEIWTYIAGDNPAAADRVVHRVAAVCQRLARFPKVGRPRDELKRGVRSVPVGNLIVFYTTQGPNVTVLRVIHAARDLALAFEQDG
jgi:toxin ParE1/3/4